MRCQCFMSRAWRASCRRLAPCPRQCLQKGTGRTRRSFVSADCGRNWRPQRSQPVSARPSSYERAGQAECGRVWTRTTGSRALRSLRWQCPPSQSTSAPSSAKCSSALWSSDMMLPGAAVDCCARVEAAVRMQDDHGKHASGRLDALHVPRGPRGRRHKPLPRGCRAVHRGVRARAGQRQQRQEHPRQDGRAAGRPQSPVRRQGRGVSTLAETLGS